MLSVRYPLPRLRLAEQETLEGETVVAGEKFALRFGFHAFGNHCETHALCQRNDGASDRGIVRIGQDIADE